MAFEAKNASVNRQENAADAGDTDHLDWTLSISVFEKKPPVSFVFNACEI
jgi:hypothetical protein